MHDTLTVRYPGRGKPGALYSTKSGVHTLVVCEPMGGYLVRDLDINVMGHGGAPEITPVVCSCGHHLVTLRALLFMWAASRPDGRWNMPTKGFTCQCGTKYGISGFDYEA